MDELKILQEIFGGSMPAPGGTGAVSVRPSKLSHDLVEQVIKEMPLDKLYHEVGVVVGQALADELEKKMLRPADYAGMPDLSKMIARRVVGYLTRSSAFESALRNQLKTRG